VTALLLAAVGAAAAVGALTGITADAGQSATAAGSFLAVRGYAAAVGGLLAAALLSRGAVRRLGGMTGDVFGAQIEVSRAAALLVLALVWPTVPG
jgi:adenosylcobinamide-GDP ribazoletransferase